MSQNMGSEPASVQVQPLPIGPPGNDAAKQQMTNTNTQLTMLMAQSAADTKYDPKKPKPETEQKIVQNYCDYGIFPDSYDVGKIIGCIGVVCIVYGLIKK
jgi:hypothetical protein